MFSYPISKGATMNYKTQQIAIVNTGEVEESDLLLLLDVDAPCHLANEDNGAASLFYIPTDYDLLTSALIDWEKFGFSHRMCQLMYDISEEDITLVYFQGY